MTLYDLLCCYKSPNWYNYCNLMEYVDQYFPANIERSLPTTVVDSYFGRLLSLAIAVNNSWSSLTADQIDNLEHINNLFNKASVFGVRPWNTKTRHKVSTFLKWGLPAEWLNPVLGMFKIGVWTWSSAATDLNDPRFLAVIREVSRIPYPATQKWFADNPDATSSNTAYEPCYNEENNSKEEA